MPRGGSVILVTSIKWVMEKAMAPHSSTFAWKIPWREEPVRLQSIGSLESETTERLHFHFSLSCIGEGNGNPLQCSCLENPRDGRAWWAAVYGVSQSRTRVKRHSSSSINWVESVNTPQPLEACISWLPETWKWALPWLPTRGQQSHTCI